MEEFNLAEASLQGKNWRVGFKKRTPKPVAVAAAVATEDEAPAEVAVAASAVSSAPSGAPVTSPMNGIFYSQPSQGSPPFVKEGDAVTAGQVVGLIEAMKVFNEIVATVSGTVTKVVVESGQLVSPGEPLLYIG